MSIPVGYIGGVQVKLFGMHLKHMSKLRIFIYAFKHFGWYWGEDKNEFMQNILWLGRTFL